MATIVEHWSHDVEDQARALNGWQQRYEQLGRGRFAGHAWQSVMAQGTLLREFTNRHLREQIIPPPEHLTLAVPLAVLPGSRFAGRSLQRESLMVLGGGEEHSLVTVGELDLIGLCVHRSMLAELSPQMQEWLQRAERLRNLDLSPNMASAIRHLLLAVSAQASDVQSSGLDDEGEMLGITLAQTVALAMRDVHATEAVPRRSEVRMKALQRAIDFMREHLYDNIDVSEVCAATCVSRRSLQYVFEEFLHTTPMAYWRALRLKEARHVLKRAGEHSITELAYALGFASASHFTQNYKGLFGELPSQTVKAGAAVELERTEGQAWG